VGLLAWAATGRRKERPITRTAAPTTDEIEAACWGCAGSGSCDCCGYALDGLEDGYCPECGWRYDSNTRVPRRKRVRGAVAGLVLLAMSGSVALVPGVARDGWMSAVPTTGLVISIPLLTSGDSVVHHELTRRIDRGELAGWQRALLSDRCAHTLTASPDESVRNGAAGLMARLGADAMSRRAQVLAALADCSPTVRVCMVEVLVAAMVHGEASGGEGLAPDDCAQVVERLMLVAARDRDELVRRRAVDGLGRTCVAESQLTRVFLKAMQDPSPRVRIRALYTVCARRVRGEMTMATLIPLREVEAATRDQHEGVREAALWVMGRMMERLDEAIAQNATMLRDPLPALRQLAAENLWRIGARSSPVWAELILSIDDADPVVRDAAMIALRTIRM